MIRKFGLRWCLAVMALAVALGVWPSRAQQQSQDQSQQNKDQNQQNQDQNQSDQQKKKKKSLFGGLKSVTGEKGEQSEATRTAGSKSVGEGQKIAETTPTATDRQALDAMENYSVSPADLKKFQADGHLQPK